VIPILETDVISLPILASLVLQVGHRAVFVRPDRQGRGTGIPVTLTGTDSVAGLTNGEGTGWKDGAAQGWRLQGRNTDETATLMCKSNYLLIIWSQNYDNDTENAERRIRQASRFGNTKNRSTML
jgi:hypothetical protein